METITSTAPTMTHGAPAPGALPAQPRVGTRLTRVRTVSVLVAALAAAVVVASGSAGWAVVRLIVVAACGWAWIRLGDRAPVATGAMGAVVASVGVGLGGHVLADVVSPIALASVALTVSGLVLTMGATVQLGRGRRWWWRTAGAVIALTTLATVGSVVVPSVIATNVPHVQLGDRPSSRGLASESVTLTTGDGVPIAAWYVASRNGAAVVLRHGAGSTRSDVLDEAAVLARHGYGVLMTDARGHGESGGRAMDFGWYGDADVAVAVEYLLGRPDVDPRRIGLVGSSMGGEEVIGAAATLPAVRAVVAEGATARRAADKDWLSSVYGWRGSAQERLEQLQDALTDLLTDAEPPTVLRTAIASSDARFLLVTAGSVADEAHAAAFMSAAAPDRVDVWTVADAPHTGGLAAAPAEWERRVVAFLDAHL